MERKLEDKILADVRYDGDHKGTVIAFMPNCKVYSNEPNSDIMEITIEDEVSGKRINIKFRKT